MWKFPGSIKKEVEFPWVVVPRGVTQFCGIPRGESLFSPEFIRVK